MSWKDLFKEALYAEEQCPLGHVNTPREIYARGLSDKIRICGVCGVVYRRDDPPKRIGVRA